MKVTVGGQAKKSYVYRIRSSNEALNNLCNILTGYINKEICRKNPQERAKALETYLANFSIKSRYLKADSNVLVIDSETIPEELNKILEKVEPDPIEKVLGFLPAEIKYEFYKGEESTTPYDILNKRPYKCDNLKIMVYYEEERYLEAFRQLLNQAGYEREKLISHYEQLRRLGDLLKDDGVKIAIIRPRKPGSKHFVDLARIKAQSYLGKSTNYGISRLQLVNGEKLITTVKAWQRYEPDKRQYYAKSLLANLLSAVYFKSGCIPFHVKLPDSKYSELLRKSLIVGIGIKRMGDSIYKGTAIVMTGYGEVMALISKDFHILRGESYEFDEKEIEEFKNEVLRHLELYSKKFKKYPELLVIIRSRMFLGREVETLLGADGLKDGYDKKLMKKLTSRSWLRNRVSRVLVMSIYKTKYLIGENMAVLASHKSSGRESYGVWLVQLKKHKYAVQIIWSYTENDVKLPLAAYLYIRGLDFTSLHESRVIPFPIREARKYLRWSLLKTRQVYLRDKNA